jgi:hypothetical protein
MAGCLQDEEVGTIRWWRLLSAAKNCPPFLGLEIRVHRDPRRCPETAPRFTPYANGSFAGLPSSPEGGANVRYRSLNFAVG